MNLRWFYSGKVRDAADMAKQVRKLANAQRDLLPPQGLEAVEGALAEMKAALKRHADNTELDAQMSKLEAVTTKWIKPYPNAGWRENTEVFLVAIVIAMGIRTFFLQPFKIPTGSMEPTLYGIEVHDLREKANFKMPDVLMRFWDAVYFGETYHQIIAPEDGMVTQLGPLQHIFHFINKQTFWVQFNGQSTAVPYTVYCGPDSDRYGRPVGLDQDLLSASFKKGEPILQCVEKTGDHLFVDRVTYNFRHPRRGDIVVFKTTGIDGIQDQSQFYIKRLVGLPGETISIGDDQHVRINGKRLDASTPHFQNVYGFDTNAPRREGKYGQWNGHVLDSRSQLRSPEDTLHVPEKGYVVFGDNTLNSFDSRFWGAVPQHNVIGKSFFVYWPVSPRFGWNTADW